MIGKWMTVGGKLTIGIALASNICLGIMLFSTYQINGQIDLKQYELLNIKDRLSYNLRMKIAELEYKYLTIPDFFDFDSSDEIIKLIENHFSIIDDRMIIGRENYKNLYHRTQRRDLAQGKFVISHENGTIIVSKGLVNSLNQFEGKIRRIVIDSSDPKSDLKYLQTNIQIEKNSGINKHAYKQKIEQLKNKLADEGLEAEKTRNEILNYVEEIGHKESHLKQLKARLKLTILVLGITAVIINIIVLYSLTKLIVEKPLDTLTKTIDDIRDGHHPEIPYTDRCDQIGSLAGALKLFSHTLYQLQQAIARLKQEDDRKHLEKALIEDVLHCMSATIQKQIQNIRQLEKTSAKLNELADETKNQSANVAQIAFNTASDAKDLSDAVYDFKGAVNNIRQEINRQNELILNTFNAVDASRHHLDELVTSTRSIHEIVAIVKKIADQTRLLAINAAIESSHRGEMGKGFNVIASEIKLLSFQTRESTNAISDKITAIIHASDKIDQSFKQIDHAIDNLTTASSSIVASIEQQNAATGNVANISSATHDNAQNLSDRIAQVSLAAVNTLDLSARVQTASIEISSSMQNLMQTAAEQLQKIGTGDLRN